MAVLGKDGEGLPLEFNQENVRSENRKGTDRIWQKSPKSGTHGNFMKFHQGKMRIRTSRVTLHREFPPAPVLLGVQISRHVRCFGAHFDLHVQGPLLRCSKINLEKKKDIVWLLYGYYMVIIWLLYGYYMVIIWLMVVNNNLVGGFNPSENIMVSWDDYSNWIWKKFKKCSKPPTSCHILCMSLGKKHPLLNIVALFSHWVAPSRHRSSPPPRSPMAWEDCGDFWRPMMINRQTRVWDKPNKANQSKR